MKGSVVADILQSSVVLGDSGLPVGFSVSVAESPDLDLHTPSPELALNRTLGRFLGGRLLSLRGDEEERVPSKHRL